jgi:DNA polymerase elongation subunit (family B)
VSYIDAILDRKTDQIHIAERVDGERRLLVVPANHVFYHEDPNGIHRSIFGHPCKKIAMSSSHKFRTALADHRRRGRRIFESDINPVFRHLADKYMGAEVPSLNIGFFDIEADFHPEKGFAPTEDPFNAVTAISLYRSADQTLTSWVLCPPTVALDAAQAIAGQFANTYMFDDEATLLDAFLTGIEDVDLLSGWNSAGYDVPYLVNRVKRILSIDATRRFCLWGMLPSKRDYMDKFGRNLTTYDFVGRVHLDYIELYRKHNTQQRLSYALNAIGELEVGETKTPYEGTLDDLYKKDLFKFIEYNRQDVMLMVKIDQKNKFIELANQIAHANCVLLKTTMGSVALVEQAIINEMHAMGFVVPDRKPRDDDDCDPEPTNDENDDEEVDQNITGEIKSVVGAYVAQPREGLRDHVGAVDIKSLYPNAICALNMSPETLVGQVRPDETMKLIEERVAKLPTTHRAEAWEGLFCTLEVQHMHAQEDIEVTVDFIDQLTDIVTTRTMTGKQLHEYVFDPANHVCITANGTLFRTDVEGMIPALLIKWYAERKQLQKSHAEWEKKKEHAATADEKTEAEYKINFYHQRQYAKKILLNSLYGALLQENCRFFDQRVGQSTTLSGRSIVKHMNASINQLVTGEYDYRGEIVVYSDTDSCYFTAYEYLKDQPEYKNFDWSRDNVIEMYDLIADEVNGTFAAFMQKTFNTSYERGCRISAGRELVASRGLFIKKKKYAVLMYDLENKRLDVDGKPGKLKVMGLDLKRADTPRFMQQFLESLLLDLLTGKTKDEMYASIRDFRRLFKDRPGWEKGAPKKVANLAAFATKRAKANNKSLLAPIQRGEVLKVNTPGHVLASLNWNQLCELYDDRHALRITDSARIIVCKLLNNSYGMTSIAYPIDETHLPKWFCNLPFDHSAMEEKVIDNKLDNLVGVLNWNLTDTKEKAGDEFFTF